MKRVFFNIVLVFLPIILVSFLMQNQYKSLVETRFEATNTTKDGKNQNALQEIKKLETEKPIVMLLGNSMLGEGIDNQQLNKYFEETISKFDIGGSATAVWYLMLKNFVFQATHQPKTLVIFFRDQFLTQPTYRTTGDYKRKLFRYASKDEPLIASKVFGDLSNQTFGRLPIYKYKTYFADDIDTLLKQTVGQPLDIEVTKLERMLNRSFSTEKMRLEDVTKSQQIAEEYSQFDAEFFDFNKQLGRSLLPHIIEIVQENGVELIFVRVKKRCYADGKEQPANLVKYMSDLESYLNEKNITLIDYTDFSKLKPSHYVDGDHLNDVGRNIFTKQFAKDMKLSLIHI